MALKFDKLTRPKIRKLKPGQKINEHGIAVECQKNGDLRFSVNVMVDGQRIHRVIGRESEGVTREQAERAIESFRTEARAGRLDLPKGRKRHRTLAEAAPDYLRRLEESGGKDLGNKRRQLDQHLVRYFGKHRLDRISEFELLKYRKQKRGEGLTDATINRHLATLSHLLRRAASKDWGWIKKDDVPPIPREREKRKQIQITTPEQDKALIGAALADHDPHIWLFILFAMTTMRHSEITRRRYDEVDWENCRLWLDRAKAGERIQPITVALRDALAARREMVDDREGWIFPAQTKNAKKPHRGSMAKPFRRVVIAAGLDPKRVTPHILRHTGISRVFMRGFDLKTAQTISGHKTLGQLMHYAHAFSPKVDEAMSAIGGSFPDTIAPELHTAPEQGAEQGANVVPISRGSSAA